MQEYLYNRIYSDCRAAIEKAAVQRNLPHNGLKGRFREIVISELLRPWLPPTCACGTGTIVSANADLSRKHFQDDIVIYDKSLMPPVRMGGDGTEGVFLFNGVLSRVEVKSKVTSQELKGFVESAVEMSMMQPATLSDHKPIHPVSWTNSLVGFATDIASGPEGEFKRISKVLESVPGYKDGAVAMICIVGSGFWLLMENGPNRSRVWWRLDTNDGAKQLVYFVATLSNTAFREHQNRSGVDYRESLAYGIGLYLEPAKWLKCF